MKRPDDALNTDRMNVKDGGKQPFMRDTVWDGHTQKMVTDEGVRKGHENSPRGKGNKHTGVKCR